jgi:hypothetical protein
MESSSDQLAWHRLWLVGKLNEPLGPYRKVRLIFVYRLIAKPVESAAASAVVEDPIDAASASKWSPDVASANPPGCV